MDYDIHTSSQQLIGYFGSIIGSISMFSTIFILVLFITNKVLRSFTFRLVIYMQISDFLLALSIIMIAAENFLDGFSLSFCKVQAFLLTFGSMSTSFWSSIITFVMLVSLKTSSSLNSLKSREKFYIFLGYFFPLIISFTALGLNLFGDSGQWCWIKKEKANWFILFFYIIIVFIILFNCIGMLYVYRYLKKLQNFNIIKQTSLFNKLRLYPIIFAILWTFPTINRISGILFDYQANWAQVMHIVCVSLFGVINMLLYAVNPKVKKVIKELIKRIFSGKKDDNMIVDMQILPETKRKSTQMTVETEEDAI